MWLQSGHYRWGRGVGRRVRFFGFGGRGIGQPLCCCYPSACHNLLEATSFRILAATRIYTHTRALPCPALCCPAGVSSRRSSRQHTGPHQQTQTQHPCCSPSRCRCPSRRSSRRRTPHLPPFQPNLAPAGGLLLLLLLARPGGQGVVVSCWCLVSLLVVTLPACARCPSCSRQRQRARYCGCACVLVLCVWT